MSLLVRPNSGFCRLATVAIPIDASTEQYADKEMQTYIEPIKQQLNKEMNQVIGESLHNMRRKAESLLSMEFGYLPFNRIGISKRASRYVSGKYG